MGAVEGSAFNFLKRIYNSPKREGLIRDSQALRMNVPRVGGQRIRGTLLYLVDLKISANASGVLCCFEISFVWWSIIALIEGAGLMLNKIMSAPQNFPVMEAALPNVAGVPGYPMGHIPSQVPVTVEGMGAESSSISSSSTPSSWVGGPLRWQKGRGSYE